jgi:hypothetical protein
VNSAPEMGGVPTVEKLTSRTRQGILPLTWGAILIPRGTCAFIAAAQIGRRANWAAHRGCGRSASGWRPAKSLVAVMLTAFADWRRALSARHGVIARDFLFADDRQEIAVDTP